MKISQFKVFLQKTQGYFENFKKIARNVAQAKRKFYDQFGNNIVLICQLHTYIAQFHTQVCVEYEKNIFSEYHNHSNEKNIFSDPTNFVLNERIEKIKGASSQPSLEYLYEWIKVESREIEVNWRCFKILIKQAFIEAITQRDRYDALKVKTQDKQKSDTLELQKVLAGKTTFKGLFSRKSKEEEVSSLEKQIADVIINFFQFKYEFRPEKIWKALP